MATPKTPTTQDINAVAHAVNTGAPDALPAARRLTRRYPSSAKAWHLLAVALLAQGDYPGALPALRRAIAISPNDAEILGHLAYCLLRRNDVMGALEAYRSAARVRPDVPDWWAGAAQCALQLDMYADAKPLAQHAIALRPDDAGSLEVLARISLADGDLAGALPVLHRIAELRPSDPAAHFNVGEALRKADRLSDARIHLHRALTLAPTLPNINASYGIVLYRIGSIQLAIDHFRRAFTSPLPLIADLAADIGRCLYHAGDYLNAESAYRIALRQNTTDARSQLALAYTILRQGRREESIREFQYAQQAHPHDLAVSAALALAFAEIGQIERALALAERCIEVDPHSARAWAAMAKIQIQTLDLDGAIKSMRQSLATRKEGNEFSVLLFLLNYHPTLAAADIFSAYKEFETIFAEPLYRFWRRHLNIAEPTRRLRIGYVSADFRGHSARYFIEPLLANHDRSAFEITAYAEVAVEDAVSERFKSYVDHWVCTVGTEHDVLADRIRADNIDILVDLSGHTSGNRLAVFARRPAPVSVTWLGYGYTTGLRAIDWFLTDCITTPVGFENLFAERVWRLSRCALVYRPEEMARPVCRLPAERRGFVTFGSLSRPIRFNSRVIATWAEILRRVPRARLELLSSSAAEPAAREEILRRFSAEGLSSDRITIADTSPAALALEGIDISLDCFPHNSGTTLIESLYMGVPYITLAERPSVGRLGSSILHAIGRDEWIADTETNYIQKAVDLSSDLEALQRIRQRLREELISSPLMDARDFTSSIESAYRAMWSQYCSDVANSVPARAADEV